MNSGESGDFTRLIYDKCEYNEKYKQMTSPIKYRMELYASENPKKCRYNSTFILKQDLVDQESELRGITRVQSKCPSMKYQPDCKVSGTCMNTYNKDFFPVVLAPENCPIVTNNLKKVYNRGYVGSTVPFIK